MFEQTFVAEGKTKKPFTVFLSFLIQVVLIIVLVLIPLIFTDSLPQTQLTSFLVAPPPPPPPPPPPAAVQQVKPVKVIKRQFDSGVLTAPKEIPKKVNIIVEDELPPPGAGVGVVGGVAGGVPGGTMGGVLGGIIGGVPTAGPPPPPPPPAAEAPKPPSRIRVGGNVQEAKIINRVQPVYPPLAKQARVSGTVRLNAVIAKDGQIQDLQVVSGHPLLVQAALQAVRQWRYAPTLLNGEPVEVVTVIDVNFTLR